MRQPGSTARGSNTRVGQHLAYLQVQSVVIERTGVGIGDIECARFGPPASDRLACHFHTQLRNVVGRRL